MQPFLFSSSRFRSSLQLLPSQRPSASNNRLRVSHNSRWWRVRSYLYAGRIELTFSYPNAWSETRNIASIPVVIFHVKLSSWIQSEQNVRTYTQIILSNSQAMPDNNLACQNAIWNFRYKPIFLTISTYCFATKSNIRYNAIKSSNPVNWCRTEAWTYIIPGLLDKHLMGIRYIKFCRSDLPKSFVWWIYQTITGVTGILLVAVLSIIYIFATQYSRRFCFRVFWITHHMFSKLSALGKIGNFWSYLSIHFIQLFWWY